jgi:ParB family chromosome partitioning protein
MLPASSRVPTNKVHIDPANKRLDLELDKLKSSIAQVGILQPPGLRLDQGRGCYFVVFGNRRVRSAQELGLEEIPAFVFEHDLTPVEIALYRAIENEQRLDLKPSERGRTYLELMELQQLSAKEVAEQLQVSPPTVSRHLAILSHPSDILALIDAGTLPLSTGVSLTRLPDEETKRDVLRQIREGHLTREKVDQTVQAIVGKKESKPRGQRVSYNIGDASISVAAPGLTIDGLIQALSELIRKARKAKETGQGLGELAAQLRKVG